MCVYSPIKQQEDYKCFILLILMPNRGEELLQLGFLLLSVFTVWLWLLSYIVAKLIKWEIHCRDYCTASWSGLSQYFMFLTFFSSKESFNPCVSSPSRSQQSLSHCFSSVCFSSLPPFVSFSSFISLHSPSVEAFVALIVKKLGIKARLSMWCWLSKMEIHAVAAVKRFREFNEGFGCVFGGGGARRSGDCVIGRHAPSCSRDITAAFLSSELEQQRPPSLSSSPSPIPPSLSLSFSHSWLIFFTLIHIDQQSFMPLLVPIFQFQTPETVAAENLSQHLLIVGLDSAKLLTL